MNRLGCIVLGEGLYLSAVACCTLLWVEGHGTMARCRKLTMRLKLEGKKLVNLNFDIFGFFREFKRAQGNKSDDGDGRLDKLSDSSSNSRCMCFNSYENNSTHHVHMKVNLIFVISAMNSTRIDANSTCCNHQRQLITFYSLKNLQCS